MGVLSNGNAGFEIYFLLCLFFLGLDSFTDTFSTSLNEPCIFNDSSFFFAIPKGTNYIFYEKYIRVTNRHYY